MLRPLEPQIGEVVGSYRLIALLGRGGMAAVFLANHTRLTRRAAVKILDAQTASDPVSVSRFLTEARLISEIEHPGVVEILDVIEQPNPLRVAYVMEHVEGPSLRRELDRRAPTPVEVARIGVQLTEALAAIHAQSVVHRDLKPANVLLTGPIDGPVFPQAKLADFGIAKAKDRPAPHKTATGLIIGTPTYMAPEQVSGEPITPATDIYALGELLYEMFTRKRVFPEDQRTSLRMKLDPHPPPLDPLPFPNSGPIWELIRACLDPEAAKRPTHDQVTDALRSIDAAPVLDPAWVERPTQLQHTATFAGPLLEEPALAPSDPVTASSLALESVEVPRPEVTPRRWPGRLAFGVLLVALGVGVWTASRDTPQPSLPPAPAPAPEPQRAALPVPTEPIRAYADEPPAPAPEPAPAAQVEAPAPEAPAPEEAAAPAPRWVQVELTSVPPGARVMDVDSGELLGLTPLSVPVRAGGRRQVRLAKDEHAPRTFTLRSSSPSARVRLGKRASPPKAEPPPPPSGELMPW